MVAAMLLSFREGLEAALILGIVLGVVRRAGRSDQTQTVWLGAGLAALVSMVAGIGLHRLGIAFEGTAEEVFEGIAMLLAAAVLTWMIFWMGRQGQALGAELERNVRRATTGSGGSWAIFSLAFMAVLREGIELALFLTAAAFSATPTATLLGGLLGLAAAAATGWLLYATTARLNLRLFFQVTSFLLIMFAAGLVAQGVHELNEVGWIPPVIEHVWNTAPLLDENSGGGELLKTILGYNANPSLTEVIAYLGYWVVVLTALWRSQERPERVPAGQKP